jgi:hypothetical protein
MAQPALKTFKRRLIAVAAANATLASATEAILTMDGAYGSETDTVENTTDSSFFGAKPVAITNKRGFIEGSVFLISPDTPGTDSANVSPILFPCGFAEVKTVGSAGTGKTRYNPVSTSFALADAKMWQGDTLQSLTDARGDLSEIKAEIGSQTKAKFRLQGDYAAITDVTHPTDAGTVLADFLEPAVSTKDNSTLIVSSLGTAAVSALHLRAKSLTINLGNEVATKEYTEFKETAINDRKPTFTARFAKPAASDINFTTLRDTQEYITLKFRVTEADGHYVEIGIRGQILTVPPTDIEGDFGYEITGNCVPSSSGGDECYIEFGY